MGFTIKRGNAVNLRFSVKRENVIEMEFAMERACDSDITLGGIYWKHKQGHKYVAIFDGENRIGGFQLETYTKVPTLVTATSDSDITSEGD